MKTPTKSFLGWLVIILLSLIPVYLWFTYGKGIADFQTYANSVHSIGELLGLVGMTMFALTFVLSTRIKFIEHVFGGLDKVYIVHGILGGTALILILFHPIFLVMKFIPSYMTLAAKYLLPSAFWSVNFGILALLGLIILVYITLFTKMKYHKWKFTHEFLGLIFALAVLHIFLVRGTVSVDNIFNGYYIYATVVSVVGLGAFSYSLFIKNRLIKNAVYKIKSIEENKSTFMFELTPEHKPLNYKSGQFVFMRFYNEKLSQEEHPFSIASKSGDETIKIIIKNLGDFTKRLEHIKVGDKVSLEGPYGRFHFKNYRNKNQVWVAGGIGITPFIGMAEDLMEEKTGDVNIRLYHSVKEDSDLVGYDFFKEVEKDLPKNFKYIPWNSSGKGYLTAEEISKVGSPKDEEFLVCGPPAFKDSVIRNLIKLGVKKNNIHEEMFDFR